MTPGNGDGRPHVPGDPGFPGDPGDPGFPGDPASSGASPIGPGPVQPAVGGPEDAGPGRAGGAGRPDGGRGNRRIVLLAFGASMVASLALTVVYAMGGQPQAEGALLGVTLGGIAVGLVAFARATLPGGYFVEPRAIVPHGVAQRPGVAAAFEAGAEPIERRRTLVGAFVGALVLLGVAAVFPVRSLGMRPGRTLLHTQWRAGRRAVGEAGHPIRLDELDVNSVVTVFPEGHVDAADSQTLLIRLPDEIVPPGPAAWTVGGVVAFSKICTHAGCPVGLYQAETFELFCPCHQSTFAVVDGARPTFGPATRPLPQLPINVDEDGFVIAVSDYTEPVGPGFWSRPR
jgi:ubiquinol-cytochrome c reductase iron-sulfur subunit